MSERATRALSEARNAAQWLARVTRSYAGQGDEIALDFDAAACRLLTPELAPGVRLCLALPTLIFQFEEQGRASPHPLDPDDKSSAEIEAWLLIELLHRGFDRAAFSKHLPYEWPDMMSGDASKYAPHDLAHELGELAQQLEAAAAVLDDARRTRQANSGAEAGALTCMPRRFDLGFDDRGAGGELVRIAFLPGDDANPPPRFVVAGPVAGSPALVETPLHAKPRGDMVTHLVAALGRG